MSHGLEECISSLKHLEYALAYIIGRSVEGTDVRVKISCFDFPLDSWSVSLDVIAFTPWPVFERYRSKGML